MSSSDEEACRQDVKRAIISQGNTPRKPPKKKRCVVSTPVNKCKATLFKRRNVPNPKVCTTPKRFRNLLAKSPVKQHKWTEAEDGALTEFVGLARTDPIYGWSPSPGSNWPAFSQGHKFWSDCAKHIKWRIDSNILLSNSRVRSRVNTQFRRMFATLDLAEERYHLTLAEMTIGNEQPTNNKKINHNPDKADTPNLPTSSSSTNTIYSVDCLLKLADQLNIDDLLNLTNSLFLKLALLQGIRSNPATFCSLALNCMILLQNNQKSNLLYKYALAICKKSPDTDEYVFPMHRMPFGLVEYQIEFFSCTNVKQIKMPADFAKWHETMCAEFPSRFNRLFRGPMWSGVPKEYQGSPLTAKVNVATVSTRVTEQRTASSEFSTEPVIQISALKKLKEANPNGRFWIKGDGCDIKGALQESVSGIWNGDVDLGDGRLQVLRAYYDTRRSNFQDIGNQSDREVLLSMLEMIVAEVESDKQFLSQGLVTSNKQYESKYASQNVSKKVLMELSWEQVEFNQLLQQSQSLISYISDLMLCLQPPDPQVQQVLKELRAMKQTWFIYLRNLFIKKRQPAATHVFVMLISDEQRNNKPYCLPIQYLPYHSLKDQTVRELGNEIKIEMGQLQMTTVGFVSDGEFNSLRTHGNKRPVHLIQLIRDARESVSRLSESTLMKLLVKVRDDTDGNPVTHKKDDAIPASVINKIHYLVSVGDMTIEDAIQLVRIQLVPASYDPYPFRNGVKESFTDVMKSLVSTYRFRHSVAEYKSQDINFSIYLYVPEVDEDTGEAYHEREDHCHILKRIWKHTREEGPQGTDLQGFDNAMRDPSTGLTHAALTGERKQSVQDAERMMSYLVGKFLCENGYSMEGNFINTVAGWHEAADGRGLAELERCRKNYAMLNMILDDWMPWHTTTYDFSTIDINRPIKGICGFSRETVVAVTTNIESMEYRRRDSFRIGYPEHPRAGTSDDVEAFISLLHRFLGNIFTVKDMKSLWRKIVREYCKRIDPELPFYYWTSNERFRDQKEEIPCFNTRPEYEEDVDPRIHPLRLHRLSVNRREDSSIFVAGRSFLPARNQTTVRQRLHRPIVQPSVLNPSHE